MFFSSGSPPTPIITNTIVGVKIITISWTNATDDPSNVCGPVMYIVTITGPGFDQTNTTNSNINTFTGLTPNTNYTITITPYNRAGDGMPNVTMVMTLPTGKAMPSYFFVPP